MIVDNHLVLDHISHTRKAEHTIMAVVTFDCDRDLYYGNDSGKMREDIRRYYDYCYARQPERVTLGMIIDDCSSDGDTFGGRNFFASRPAL